ncbi:hypothetical protein FN846DRAFT_894443 [Sphaerosporella brunnea]|uniref:Uncharacterized protein n=1 Tax=Sphaerosporella brunnea TaxID=1250544 RepID=A0A5J5EJ61_9PEZI|nr:hypothetical protein FN846DRAFT_894443 [Sphaerosporella brunnea]
MAQRSWGIDWTPQKTNNRSVFDRFTSFWGTNTAHDASAGESYPTDRYAFMSTPTNRKVWAMDQLTPCAHTKWLILPLKDKQRMTSPPLVASMDERAQPSPRNSTTHTHKTKANQQSQEENRRREAEVLAHRRAEELAEANFARMEKSERQAWEEANFLRSMLKNERIQHDHEKQQLRETAAGEIQKMQSKLDELEIKHIQTVNSMGTGIEPIATQTFVDRFRALHDEVSRWCRKAFGKGKLVSLNRMPGIMHDLHKTQFYDLGDLRPSLLINMLVWTISEREIFSHSIPGLPQLTETLSQIEELVRGSDTPDTGEKATHWRAYTVSRIYQNPVYREKVLENVRNMAQQFVSTELERVLQNPQFQENSLPALEQALLSIHVLAADLKCQKAVYEMDRTIRLGDLYDETTMEDVKFSSTLDEAGRPARVIAILSRGWVKVHSDGPEKIQEHVCKTRVLVGIVPEETTPLQASRGFRPASHRPKPEQPRPSKGPRRA